MGGIPFLICYCMRVWMCFFPRLIICIELILVEEHRHYQHHLIVLARMLHTKLVLFSSFCLALARLLPFIFALFFSLFLLYSPWYSALLSLFGSFPSSLFLALPPIPSTSLVAFCAPLFLSSNPLSLSLFSSPIPKRLNSHRWTSPFAL